MVLLTLVFSCATQGLSSAADTAELDVDLVDTRVFVFVLVLVLLSAFDVVTTSTWNSVDELIEWLPLLWVVWVVDLAAVLLDVVDALVPVSSPGAN